MMTKLEQAARQALEALEELHYSSGTVVAAKKYESATAALREALDHSGEADKMVGCAYCNNPLFAGTKCNNCGLVTLAEQAERVTEGNGSEVSLETETQEPVAWMVTMENQDGTRKTFPLSGRYKDVRDMCDFGDPIPLYAAPVRTKDLSDDEVRAIANEWQQQGFYMDFARAVIAADREKNK